MNKTESIPFYCTPQMALDIQYGANLEGISRSAYVRKLIQLGLDVQMLEMLKARMLLPPKATLADLKELKGGSAVDEAAVEASEMKRIFGDDDEPGDDPPEE